MLMKRGVVPRGKERYREDIERNLQAAISCFLWQHVDDRRDSLPPISEYYCLGPAKEIIRLTQHEALIIPSDALPYIRRG